MSLSTSAAHSFIMIYILYHDGDMTLTFPFFFKMINCLNVIINDHRNICIHIFWERSEDRCNATSDEIKNTPYWYHIQTCCHFCTHASTDMYMCNVYFIMPIMFTHWFLYEWVSWVSNNKRFMLNFRFLTTTSHALQWIIKGGAEWLRVACRKFKTWKQEKITLIDRKELLHQRRK